MYWEGTAAGARGGEIGRHGRLSVLEPKQPAIPPLCRGPSLLQAAIALFRLSDALLFPADFVLLNLSDVNALLGS